MALEQNGILYDVDIDLQDSLREIDQLRQHLKSFSDNLAVDTTKVQQAMRKAAADYVNYIRKLEQEIRKLRSQGKDVTAQEARLNQIRDRQRSASAGTARSNALGSDQSLAARSVLQRQLNEMRSTTNELVGKYFDELNNSYLRAVRRSLTNVQNEERLLRGRMEDRNYRAQHGDAAFGFMKQRERRGLNGGANQFASQFGILTNYAMVGSVYGAAFSLGNFIVQLDAQFKQFQAITASTNTEMKLMEDRLLSVSEKTKFTANEIAEAATLMGQAGMSASEVAEAIQPISLLATAAGTQLKEAVDVVTSALNIFGLQTSEAGHLADVFTAALNESKLTLDQLTLSLQYAGNIAATAGVSYNELTAAVGALANAGIRSGSTMGTGLRQLMVDLMAPTKNLKEILDRLGLTVQDIDIKTNGLAGVMSNLRAAGFDTADAFEGLEVRAAAAFTALANNLDTMANLRQSFVLNNAAAEANEIQMESLANTAKKFHSNLGALVYTAFRPFLATLQDALNLTGDMLSALRSLGPVVELVGSAFAILASAFIIARVGRLIAGLIGLGAAATGAATAMGLLRAATLGNPLFFGAAVLITGIQMLASYGDRANRVKAALDELETQQNAYQASVDRTNNRITSLNEAMDDLQRKQAALDKEGNEQLRQTRIMEVVSSFEELAGRVDASSSSVSTLIGAMRELKNELASGLPDEFGLLVDKIDQRIEVLRKATRDQARGESSLMASWAASARFGNGGAIYSSEKASYNDRIAETFGENIAEAFKIATSQIEADEVDGLRATSLRNILQRAIIDNERQLSPLKDKEGLFGFSLTTEEASQIADLRKNLSFLRSLNQSFEPIANYRIQESALQLDRDVQVHRQAQATLANTPAYRGAELARSDAAGMLAKRLGAITRDDLPTQETQKAFDDLKVELNRRLETINGMLRRAADQMRQSGEFSDEEIQDAVQKSGVKNSLAELESAFTKDAKGASEASKKLLVYLFEQDQKTVQKKTAAIRKQLSDAQNERQVDLLERQLYALDDQLAELELKAFDLDEHKQVGTDPADLEIAKRKLRDQQRERRDSLITSVIEQRADMAEEANKVTDKDLKNKLKNIQDEMKNLAQSINNNSTEAYIKTVRDKLEELNKKAQELAGRIAGISVSGDFGAFSVGDMPTANADDIQRSIIAAANKAGIPAQIALAIASFESGFDSTAKNPNSSAAGIFQNTDPNWASHGLTPGDRNSVEMQIFAGIQDMSRTQKALASALGTTNLRFQDYYGSHLLGQEGYKRVLENPTGNAVSVLGTDVVAGNGGNIGQTAQEFLDMVVAKAAEHLDKVKGLIQAPADAAASVLQTEIEKLTRDDRDTLQTAEQAIEKNQTHRTVKLLDSQSKAIEAQINALTVQSTKALDPDAIQSIIDQVHKLWGDLMQKEVDAFTAANTVKGEKTDDFDDRLEQLEEQLKAGLVSKVVSLLDRYQQSIENLQFGPLQRAEARREAAQNPLNSSKFTEAQVQGLEKDVQLQQRIAQQERLSQLMQLHMYILQQVAAAELEYGKNSQMVLALKERQQAVELSLGKVRLKVEEDTKAAARSELTLRDAIESANRAWAQRNGLLDQNGDPTSFAQRFGESWGQVLDGLSNSMSTLFTDLATKPKDAEDAFRRFGLSVIQMLMQMIAKMLVFKMIQTAIGMFGGGGDPWAGLRGAGAATGQIVPGVKRSALGEIVGGASPFRDSELRMVMPGEAILRASAVNQIGRDNIDRVNARGNRRLASGMPSLPAPAPVDKRPINVWAVLPDEKPQLGPDDVVAYISDDIRRRGVTRTLIKAINAGKI